MNLDDVLKEASIIDHSWYEKGMLKPGEPTFDAEGKNIRKRNNIKPELEVEFGMAGPSVDLNEPAGMVTRNIPDEALGDADSIILFARDQMNRGVMGKKLISSLKSKFDSQTLKKASNGLRKMFALEGIVGCIAVDGRGYKNCHEAMKAASSSPYKHFIKHVIGCQCGDPHSLPAGGIGGIVGAENKGGSVDGFLTSNDIHKTELVSHCRSTMMPILSFRGDLDPSETDQTLVEMMNMSGLPEEKYRELHDDKKNQKYSNLQTIQAAFRWLNARNESLDAKKAAGKAVKSDEIMQFGIADTEVDVMAPMLNSDMDAIPQTLETPQMGDVLVIEESVPAGATEDVSFDEDLDAVSVPLEVNMRQEEIQI